VKAKLYWTPRALSDLRGIRDFIRQDSPHYASVVVGRVLEAVERLETFPESGREVPEFARPDLREVIVAPYRVVYRIVNDSSLHVIAVHHSARLLRK
jgi:addiction module RelE/StbE family toxin